MDFLESFAIGFSSSSLLTHLKENEPQKGKPYVPHVMKIFGLTDHRGLVVNHTGVLNKLCLLEQNRMIESYKSSLRAISDKGRLDEESRDELVLFLDSISDYCIETLQRPRY